MGDLQKYISGFPWKQPDQVNMAVLFWYLVKSDASVRIRTVYPIVYSTLYIRWTRHVIQGTRTTRQCITGHPVVDPDPHI